VTALQRFSKADELEAARLTFARLLGEAWRETGNEPVEGAPPLRPDLTGLLQLHPSREAMLVALPQGGRMMEIGTWAGDFARRMIDQLKPDRLDIVDISFERLRSDIHDDVKQGRVHLHLGDSRQVLRSFDAETFDFVYVDGLHSYEGAYNDIEQAIRIVKPGGLIGVNDYTTWCAVFAMSFGVMKAANELANMNGLKAVHFALHHQGNHDIVFQKSI
jgi:SAM-dependent methyltransferase